MQQIISRVITYLPCAVGKIPYDLSYLLIRVLAKSHGLTCWARNSYFQMNLSPGISDIDITILDNASSSTHIKIFTRRYEKLKRLVPVLGEINYYRLDILDQISNFINSYELKRDPILEMKIGAKTPHQLEGFVFLIRMLESDTKRLIANPQTRIVKWKKHLSDTKILLPNPFNLEKLIHTISKISGLDSNEISIFFNDYISQDIELFYSKYRKEKKIKIFIVLYPHRWMVYANGINDMEICLKNIIFDEVEVKIIHEQLKWECFGLISQSHKLNKKNVLNYLEIIQKFIDLLRTSSEAKTGVEQLQIEVNKLRLIMEKLST